MGRPNYKKYPFANEQSELKIGRFYSVWHVEIYYHFRDKKFMIPINPILHKDKQFGADFLHYHIDGRFGIHKTMQAEFTVKMGITNRAVIYHKSEYDKRYNYEILQLIVLKRKCVRLETGVNPPLVQKPNCWNNYETERPTKYAIWYDTMIGKSCAGRKCPHLGTTMQVKGNKLVCPLHNLHGDLKKEVIIPFKIHV